MAKKKPWSAKRGRAPKGARPRRKLLVFCEDTKSSALYFRAFPIDLERFEVAIVGTGMNTDSLVEEAIERGARSKGHGINCSDVWCVLDRDSFPEQNYNRAFQLAAAKGIKLAWANEAFELWYILHFDYLCTGLSRSQYKHKLEERGVDYDKADEDIYDKLRDRQPAALKNAQRLEAHWRQSGRGLAERENPSTSVHKLVDVLNDLAALPPAH